MIFDQKITQKEKKLTKYYQKIRKKLKTNFIDKKNHSLYYEKLFTIMFLNLFEYLPALVKPSFQSKSGIADVPDVIFSKSFPRPLIRNTILKNQIFFYFLQHFLLSAITRLGFSTWCLEPDRDDKQKHWSFNFSEICFDIFFDIFLKFFDFCLMFVLI